MSKKYVLKVKQNLRCIRDGFLLEFRSDEEARDENKVKIRSALTLLRKFLEVTV